MDDTNRELVEVGVKSLALCLMLHLLFRVLLEFFNFAAATNGVLVVVSVVVPIAVGVGYACFAVRQELKGNSLL